MWEQFTRYEGRHILWLDEWNVISSEDEAAVLQEELGKELSDKHPMFKYKPRIIARDEASDDVLAILNNGTFASIHLTWSSKVDQFPDKFPSTGCYLQLNDVEFCILEGTLMYCKKCSMQLDPEKEMIRQPESWEREGARCSSCNYLYYPEIKDTWKQRT
jgi:hypothetical protein